MPAATSQELLDQLDAESTTVPVNPALSLARHYQTASALLSQAYTYGEEDDILSSYVLYRRFVQYYLKNIIKHKDRSHPRWTKHIVQYRTACDTAITHIEQLRTQITQTFNDQKQEEEEERNQQQIPLEQQPEQLSSNGESPVTSVVSSDVNANSAALDAELEARMAMLLMNSVDEPITTTSPSLPNDAMAVNHQQLPSNDHDSHMVKADKSSSLSAGPDEQKEADHASLLSPLSPTLPDTYRSATAVDNHTAASTASFMPQQSFPSQYINHPSPLFSIDHPSAPPLPHDDGNIQQQPQQQQQPPSNTDTSSVPPSHTSPDGPRVFDANKWANIRLPASSVLPQPETKNLPNTQKSALKPTSNIFQQQPQYQEQLPIQQQLQQHQSPPTPGTYRAPSSAVLPTYHPQLPPPQQPYYQQEQQQQPLQHQRAISPYNSSQQPFIHPSMLAAAQLMPPPLPTSMQQPRPAPPSALASPNKSRNLPPKKVRFADYTTPALRPIHLPISLMQTFMQYAQRNTVNNIETCAILAGKLLHGHLYITHVIIPHQQATADTCVTEDEDELFFIQSRYDLLTLGWIHTHPSQSCFLSSVDLHTHYSYQLMMSEAIAIVMSPSMRQERGEKTQGIFHITNEGMSILAGCNCAGFHQHNQAKGALFEESKHVILEGQQQATFIDLRHTNTK